MHAVRASRRAALLLMAALVAACASPPRAGDGETVWSGRMALRVDSTPPQSFGSAFELRGGPDAGELRLASPLGNTLATVVWSPAGAELRQGSQVTRRGSLDDLTAELGGAPLPVGALFSWLRGQATTAPGWTADLSQHAEGRISARRESPAPTAELRLVFEP